ncbi:MAG: hypothetical protein PHQ86_09570, partial [Dehalococcoidales bacterium]|nr:hypothetical protein [Dehalococcoidales bacterium]
MAEQLGKINKPDIEHFTNKRKLCIVPLIFCGKEAPTEYLEKYSLYWKQINEQITNLESKIGAASHIYHESITLSGEDGLKVIEQLNPSSYQITSEKCQNGATLELTEDKDLSEECIDWERCLIMGFISQKVAKMVTELYVTAAQKRYEHIIQRINETLKDEELGILFIREGHMLQFPQDIEVFRSEERRVG